jgi:hypothetical protein
MQVVSVAAPNREAGPDSGLNLVAACFTGNARQAEHFSIVVNCAPGKRLEGHSDA